MERSCFISYRHNPEGIEFLKKLVRKIEYRACLGTNKEKVYFAYRDMECGDNFGEEIYKYIPNSLFFIPIYHNSYLDTSKLWCAREFYHAIKVQEIIHNEINKEYNFIMPLILQGDSTNFPLEIAKLNAKFLEKVECCIWNDQYDEISTAFFQELGKVFEKHYLYLDEDEDFYEKCKCIERPTDEEIKNWIREQKGIKKRIESQKKPILEKNEG